MKKSILTMFFVVLISSLNSVTASPGPFTPGLCTGGSIHAAKVYANVFAPPLLLVTPGDVATYCADACSELVVGCNNSAKTASQCRLGLTNDLLRVTKEECSNAADISDCKQAATLAANDRKDRVLGQKSTAEDYCDNDVYPVCEADCVASFP